MGSVIPLKKSANSAYLELKNLLGNKLQKVEDLIEQRLNLLYKDKHILKIENSEKNFSVALTIQTNED